MTTEFDDDLKQAISAFAHLDEYTALQAMRAEADYDHEIDEWITRYIDEQGGGEDDEVYDALHADAQETPEFAEFSNAVRAEILKYFEVTEEQLELMIILRTDDSEALWEEINRLRADLGTGEVRGDL